LTINKATLERFYPAEEIDWQLERYLAAQEAHVRQEGLSGSSDGVRFFRGPGRANLAGCHTDHQGGLVLPIAIDNDTVVAAKPNGSRLIRAYDANLREYRQISIDDLAVLPEEKGDWAAFLRGIASGINDKKFGLQGIDMVIAGNVAVGSGLSSSAALETSVATAINEICELGIDPLDLAIICQAAERDYYGKQCGLMDQTISLCAEEGHALRIDFKESIPKLTPVYLRAVEEGGYKLVVVNSGVSHSGLDKLYNQIPSDMRAAARLIMGNDDPNLRLADVIEYTHGYQAKIRQSVDEATAARLIDRTEYFYDECARVEAITRAMSAGNMQDVGLIMEECGTACVNQLKNVYIPDSYTNIPAPERRALEILMTISKEFGTALGTSNFGGGFGGPIRAWLPAEDVDRYMAHMVNNARGEGLPNITAKAYLPRAGACEVKRAA
jgi:galactokinase